MGKRKIKCNKVVKCSCFGVAQSRFGSLLSCSLTPLCISICVYKIEIIKASAYFIEFLRGLSEIIHVKYLALGIWKCPINDICNNYYYHSGSITIIARTISNETCCIW